MRSEAGSRSRPRAKWSRTRPAVTAAIASSSIRMPSVTRPLTTCASPRSESASISRSTSPKRRAIASAETASCSRSAVSRVNGAFRSLSQPCAAHSSTPSSTLSARSFQPKPTLKLPWYVTYMNASQIALSDAGANCPARVYSSNARSLSSIARSYSRSIIATLLSPVSASGLSPCSSTRSRQTRALRQSAAAIASSPSRTRCSRDRASIMPIFSPGPHPSREAVPRYKRSSSARLAGWTISRREPGPTRRRF